MKIFRKIMAVVGVVAVAIVAVRFFVFKIMPDKLDMTMLCINALFGFSVLFFGEEKMKNYRESFLNILKQNHKRVEQIWQQRGETSDIVQYKVQIENQEQAEFVMMSMSQVIWYAVDMEGMPEPGGYKSYLKGMKVEVAE